MLTLLETLDPVPCNSKLIMTKEHTPLYEFHIIYKQKLIKKVLDQKVGCLTPSDKNF